MRWFRKRPKPAPAPKQWVRQYDEGLWYLDNLDGTSWWDAPVPPRRHRCTAQTRGLMPNTGYVERCACGAIYLFNGWIERNRRSV